MEKFFAGAVSFFLFLFLVRSVSWEKKLGEKQFLLLLALLSLAQTALFINFLEPDSLFLWDDHPIFYTYTVEQARLLLEHGTPFGFNHNFQGGIPTFSYLRSCFLEYIPFSFFFEEQAAYTAMLAFFIILIPLSIYCLIFELTKKDNVARLSAIIAAASQLGIWPYLDYGMTAAVVGMPIALFFLTFLFKYTKQEKYPLLPVLFFSWLLLYTHIILFVVSWMLFCVFFVHNLAERKKDLPRPGKIFLLIALTLVAGLPFFYNFFIFRSFLNTNWTISGDSITGVIPVTIIDVLARKDISEALVRKIPFLVSMFFLIILNHSRDLAEDNKKTIRKALQFSAVILVVLFLRYIPDSRLSPKLIFLRTEMFVPYITLFNLSLFCTLKMKNPARVVRVAGVVAIFCIISIMYPPHYTYLETVNNAEDIDKTLKNFIKQGDYVLFENSAHLNPAKNREEYDPIKYDFLHDHYLPYLQKNLGVRFFSHMGNDAHPYNALGEMYIVNSYYRGEPILADNAEHLREKLKEWGVNKACAWTPGTKNFLDRDRHFTKLGESEKYACYEANYPVQPEVGIEKGGSGRIVDVDPFSFKVLIENISGMSRVTINKNYFSFWRAYDEKGNEIPVERVGQKISFETEHDGFVNFKYSKNILLNLLSITPFIFLALRRLSSLRS